MASSKPRLACHYSQLFVIQNICPPADNASDSKAWHTLHAKYLVVRNAFPDVHKPPSNPSLSPFLQIEIREAGYQSQGWSGPSMWNPCCCPLPTVHRRSWSLDRMCCLHQSLPLDVMRGAFSLPTPTFPLTSFSTQDATVFSEIMEKATAKTKKRKVDATEEQPPTKINTGRKARDKGNSIKRRRSQKTGSSQPKKTCPRCKNNFRHLRISDHKRHCNIWQCPPEGYHEGRRMHMPRSVDHHQSDVAVEDKYLHTLLWDADLQRCRAAHQVVELTPPPVKRVCYKCHKFQT
ncbi:hypothetical protein GQ53DRAFT_763903 [Thozetella sp. PMI_491]|nr:hypothetical protein GQ53DRAFT_763903 [Thozetella sp. PMI_491]